MEVSNVLLWLIAGIILVTLEFTALPGVGLLFAGFAALIAGIATENGGASLTYQWVIFFSTTIILALLFYKPLRNYQTTKDAKYTDMIGHSAVVIGTLMPGVEGQVKWSGTTMRARLQTATPVAEGKTVKIAAVDGNVLVVHDEQATH